MSERKQVRIEKLINEIESNIRNMRESAVRHARQWEAERLFATEKLVEELRRVSAPAKYSDTPRRKASPSL